MADTSNSPVTEPVPTKKSGRKTFQIVAVVGVISLLVLTLSLVVLRSMRSDESTSDASEPEVLIVEITDDGFVPQSLQVPMGGTVKWINKTNNPYRIAANPQPSHESLPELDSQEPIGPDGEYSFTFTKEGTFIYNNHYSPTPNDGEIIVGAPVDALE